MMMNIGKILDLVTNEFQNIERTGEPSNEEKNVAATIVQILHRYKDGGVIQDVELDLPEGTCNLV